MFEVWDDDGDDRDMIGATEMFLSDIMTASQFTCLATLVHK